MSRFVRFGWMVKWSTDLNSEITIWRRGIEMTGIIKILRDHAKLTISMNIATATGEIMDQDLEAGKNTRRFGWRHNNDPTFAFAIIGRAFVCCIPSSFR